MDTVLQLLKALPSEELAPFFHSVKWKGLHTPETMTGVSQADLFRLGFKACEALGANRFPHFSSVTLNSESTGALPIFSQ